MKEIDRAQIGVFRERFLDSGIRAEDFIAVTRSAEISFQDIFGANTLMLVEFDVVLLGEHSHLVFVPPTGEPCEALTAYPDSGLLRVAAPVPWIASRHSPVAKPGPHRAKAVCSPFHRHGWLELSKLAQQIDDAQLNYHFLKQNSNSVTTTLLAHFGLEFVDLKGGGFNPGATNNLLDEVSGGRQTGQLLFRAGASYLGYPVNRRRISERENQASSSFVQRSSED